ncbi:MAG: histidine kinase dimerization/phospho-acceptor domain-containing protein, partial [Acidimicrobiia bacterium]
MRKVHRAAPWTATTGAALLMALAAISGLGLHAGAMGITIFWPAAGVAAALVTTAPQRLRRNVLAGVFLGTVLSAIPMGGDKWAFILGAAIANTVEAHIAGKILRGRLPEAHRIVRVSDIRALFKAGGLGPAAGAVIGGTVTAITFDVSFGGAALSWFAADALGIALIAPGALAIVSAIRDRSPIKKWIHTLLFGLASVGVLMFTILLGALTSRNFAYLLLVPLIVSAIYLGQRGTVMITAVTSFLNVIATESGIGPFVIFPSQVPPIIAALAFLLVTQVVLLFVSTEATRRRDLLGEIEGVFDAALDGVLLVDEGDIIRRANQSSQDMLGGHLLGERFTDFLVQPLDAEVMVAHRAVLTRGRRIDGTEFWAEVSEGQVIENSNRVRRAIVIRDATPRIEAQDKLEKMRDQFVSNMTHELRTPLTAIIGYTEWLLEGAVGETKADLELVRASARSLSGIVDEILDFKRSAETEATPTDVDFSLLVEKVKTSLDPAAESRHVDVAMDVEPGVDVMGDYQQLERIVGNLL